MTTNLTNCSVSCDSYASNITPRIYEHLVRGVLSDCVIFAEGKFVRAHKLILSVSSEYFENVFKNVGFGFEKPVIVMPPNVTFMDLCSILDFAYLGHANVPHERLNDFLKIGELFQIRGIKDGRIHFMTNQAQQYAQNVQPQTSVQVQVQQPIVIQSVQTSTSFDSTITSSTQQETTRVTGKRAREDDDPDISLQEASEIMKMLLENPELEDHPIKAEPTEIEQSQQPSKNIKLSTSATENVGQTVDIASKHKFLCRYCGRGLSTKGRVNKHENECNDNPNREVCYCEVCKMELKPSSFNHHMNAKHGIKNGGKTPRQNNNPTVYTLLPNSSPEQSQSLTILIPKPTELQSPDGNQLEKTSTTDETPSAIADEQTEDKEHESNEIAENNEEIQIDVD